MICEISKPSLLRIMFADQEFYQGSYFSEASYAMSSMLNIYLSCILVGRYIIYSIKP